MYIKIPTLDKTYNMNNNHIKMIDLGSGSNTYVMNNIKNIHMHKRVYASFALVHRSKGGIFITFFSAVIIPLAIHHFIIVCKQFPFIACSERITIDHCTYFRTTHTHTRGALATQQKTYHREKISTNSRFYAIDAETTRKKHWSKFHNDNNDGREKKVHICTIYNHI